MAEHRAMGVHKMSIDAWRILALAAVAETLNEQPREPITYRLSRNQKAKPVRKGKNRDKVKAARKQRRKQHA